MITFILSLAALVLGYIFYGRFVERVFGPDDRVTPAVSKADGLDYIVMPGWKIFMIQFLNIAGTGPIFGAIMGAKFGPAAYPMGIACFIVASVWFAVWYRKESQK
jgi:carbon starvation protein CstA